MATTRRTPFTHLFHLLLLRRGPAAPRSWVYRGARLLVLLAYTYLGLLVLLLLFENRLLFHPVTATDYWEAPPANLPVRDVEVIAGDGTHVHGWWSAPTGWRPDDGAVLFCHGNAGNVSGRGGQIAEWVTHRNQAVFAFDYPGFGKSDGAPTEAGCYAAADAAYDYVTRTEKVPGTRVLLYGESLGGAVATDLASRRPCRALVLASTFTSFPDVAQERYPFFPGRWLVRNQFRSVEKIRACTAPVFIGHGTADGLVPFAQGQRLFAAANGPKEFVTMPGLDHEPPSPDFFVKLMKFLAEVEKQEFAPPVSRGGD